MTLFPKIEKIQNKQYMKLQKTCQIAEMYKEEAEFRTTWKGVGIAKTRAKHYTFKNNLTNTPKIFGEEIKLNILPLAGGSCSDMQISQIYFGS